ncbi:MAG: helix-turn-helix domain-containing protein [Candidatus Dormibacteraceae bacterium]
MAEQADERAGESLGGRIRKLRQERGLSLAQVAGGDFSRAFLNQVELGKSQTSTRTLRIIAARLGTRVEYLLGGTIPTLDREIALERARIMLVRGRPRRSLRELEGLLELPDWPLGADARLCAAQALIELGRAAEATGLLRSAGEMIASHGDQWRGERLAAIRSRAPGRGGDAAEHLVRLGDRALRAGTGELALERYREARVLLEAAVPERDI